MNIYEPAAYVLIHLRKNVSIYETKLNVKVPKYTKQKFEHAAHLFKDVNLEPGVT